MANQYLDRKAEDPDWLFKEFLAALTDDELWGCISWQLQQMRCKDCHEHPCQTPCQPREDAEHRLQIADQEVRKRGTWRGRVLARDRPLPLEDYQDPKTDR